MKLWVLADNNTLIDRYFLGEPAFSCYLEIDGQRILLDTGYSDVFLKNAEALGIDLSRLTHIVLSHGHNDHSNGLSLLHQRFDLSRTLLVAHSLCFVPRWEGDTYIGPPYTDDIGQHYRCTLQPEPCWLSENCVFLGEIPTLHDFEARRPIGRMELEGREQPDLILDDSALACKTPEGLFIITGCSHSGICNIVSYARQICGETRIAGIIGGFHLPRADRRVRQTIAFLETLGSPRLYPCHCVSLAAKAAMMRTLDIQEVGSGMCIQM